MCVSVCIHIKYQDYTFVLACEVRERTEVSLLVYGTSLSQVIFWALAKEEAEGGLEGETEPVFCCIWEGEHTGHKKEEKTGPCSSQARVSPMAICDTV